MLYEQCTQCTVGTRVPVKRILAVFFHPRKKGLLPVSKIGVSGPAAGAEFRHEKVLQAGWGKF